ncbi:hypothetical protein BDP81DRAFT_80152 [Colletotrichum phormii]|uniref:Uncharacterized protein n=1 Tax=Colletotrichum phormii TaxID=359342 RepID=A0AAJ0A0L3_9PEZI|nr:uncharacterized protein BDP81DRAFT_80152 [Colletotrichum phormii]KAK1654252.1 hypothetical protein BDP81DRAFT_80152 [Colletotrichum phormii]
MGTHLIGIGRSVLFGRSSSVGFLGDPSNAHLHHRSMEEGGGGTERRQEALRSFRFSLAEDERIKISTDTLLSDGVPLPRRWALTRDGRPADSGGMVGTDLSFCQVKARSSRYLGPVPGLALSPILQAALVERMLSPELTFPSTTMAHHQKRPVGLGLGIES